MVFVLGSQAIQASTLHVARVGFGGPIAMIINGTASDEYAAQINITLDGQAMTVFCVISSPT